MQQKEIKLHSEDFRTSDPDSESPGPHLSEELRELSEHLHD